MSPVNIILFLSGLLIPLLLLGVAFLLAFRTVDTGHKAQDNLLHLYADKLAQGLWYRVRYASSGWFVKVWKAVPWEVDGILHVGAEAMTFYGFDRSGKLRELCFPAHGTTARWYGVRYWPNGLLHWFVLHSAGQDHYFTADTGATVLKSRTMTQEIVQRVQHRLAEHVDDGSVAAPFVPAAFALDKNPYTVSALVLAGLMGGYGLVDILLNTEMYAAAPSYTLYAVVGGVFALLTSAGLLRLKIPKAESLGLGMLLGVVIGLACYPGLLRLNQLTDVRGLQSHAYTLYEDLSLRPPEAHLPTLKFAGEQEYWAQFTPGSLHQFQLRRGRLGFYQVDMGPIYEKTRRYYATQNAK